MTVQSTVKFCRQWLNGSRPRILVWYFLLTAFSSVASILVTYHILYERIRDQSQEYVSHQVQALQQSVQEQPAEVLLPEQHAKALFDRFFSSYQPIDQDDYAIAFLQNQVYRYTDSFPQELLSQETRLRRKSRAGAVDCGSDRPGTRRMGRTF